MTRHCLRPGIAPLLFFAFTTGSLAAQDADRRPTPPATERLLAEIRRADVDDTHRTRLRVAHALDVNRWERPSLRLNEQSDGLMGAATPAPETVCCWTRVGALREGQWITVDIAGGQRFRGRVVKVDDTGVVLTSAAATRRIDRADVVKIRAEPTRRMKVAGFMTAGGAGLVIANAAARPAEALPGKLWFAGIPLTVVGAAMMHHEMRRTGVIYGAR